MMVVIAVLFFLISATITETAPAEDYDYTELEMSWPPSVCAVKGCNASSLPEEFTIHGLWPVKNGSSVVNCSGEDFREDKIASLKPSLNLYWVSIPSDVPNGISWAHQWNVHGKCTKLPIFDYFNSTLERFLKFDLTAELKVDSITPGNSYDPTRFSSSIFEATGYTPIVRCKKIDNVQVLYSVALCYDKNATDPKLQDCPDIPPIKCDYNKRALLVAKTAVSMYKPGTKDGLWSM